MKVASRGFTLIEAIVALALAGLVVLGLATLTAQWFSQWNHAAGTLQTSEALAAGFDRFMNDLGAAEASAPPNSDQAILFEGTATSLTFWRTRLSVRPEFGMELVHYSLDTTSDHTTLVRRHVHIEPGEPLRGVYQWQDPVELARLPFALTFSYIGEDGKFSSNWHNRPTLPDSVLLSALDTQSAFVPVQARLHAEIPASCAAQTEISGCLAIIKGGPVTKPQGQTP